MNGKSPGSSIKSWGGSLQVTHIQNERGMAESFSGEVGAANKSLPMGSVTDPSSVTRAWYATHVCIHLQVKWLTSHSAQTGAADRISLGLETTLIDKNKMNTYKTWLFMNGYKKRRLSGKNMQPCKLKNASMTFSFQLHRIRPLTERSSLMWPRATTGIQNSLTNR